MHRRQRHATARVGLGTFIVGVALSLMFVGASPAHAAGGGDSTSTAATPSASTVHRGPVVYRTSIPKQTRRPALSRAGKNRPPHAKASVDWQWLKGGWEIKFNWAETRQMARGFSYCTVVAALLPTGISQGVAAACGILWIVADVAKDNGRCVKIFLPLSMVNPTIGTWSCSH